MKKIMLLSLFFLVSCHHRPDIELERGDEVMIVDCFEDKCFYAACKKLTYIAGQALDRENAVWLLAEGCPWYQYPDIGLVTTLATVQMRSTDIVKGHNSDNHRNK